MKTIYNTYVPMESQEQCDRMKKLCIDNNLPYWKEEIAFEITKLKKEKSWFWYDSNENEFFIVDLTDNDVPLDYLYSEITEQEFIELLKTK